MNSGPDGLVHCARCGRTKKPIGRDQPPGTDYCTSWDCEGYYEPPYPSTLWPGEIAARLRDYGGGSD